MKVITSSLKYFIVQKLRISNKEAVQHITSGSILVNGKKGFLNQPLTPEDVVSFKNINIKEGQPFVYLAYYKPRGVEATLNSEIPDNLIVSLNFPGRVFPVGRLDKDSEGLMLLTNNGKIFDKIIHAESHQEKEYLVTVDKPLTQEVITQLTNGVIIMGKKTRPAVVKKVAANSFKITLTQGLNRQIRRMCYKLGYQVEQLIRTRLVTLTLGNLKPGEWRYLNHSEIELLQNKISGN